MNLLGKLKATGIGIPISAINPGDGQAYQASGTLGTIIAWFCNIGRKLAGKQPAYLSHITIALRNPADRRNPAVECIPVGKQNWGYAPGYATNAFQATYPNI